MKYNVRKFEETIIELIKGSEIKMVIKYMKKKCNICGHIVTTGAVMCEYCGNKIDISDTGRDKIKISSRTLLIINLLLFIIGCITVYICFKLFLSFKDDMFNFINISSKNDLLISALTGNVMEIRNFGIRMLLCLVGFILCLISGPAMISFLLWIMNKKVDLHTEVTKYSSYADT